jgi:predicted ATPase
MASEKKGILPESFTTFGELLRFLRVRNGLSQREFAAQVGYHYSHVNRFEKNIRTPPDRATLLATFAPVLKIENEPIWLAHLLKLASLREIPAQPRMEKTDSEENIHPWPFSLTSIIGRTQETTQLTKLLLQQNVRLLTIVGPPGVGKTRLAIHAAEEVQSQFSDGIFFVNLAPVENADDVLSVFSEALELQDIRGATKQIALQSFLKDRNMLIVLDNFEQVIPASKYLPPLLAGAPKVKFLVTSRETLRLSGEYEFQLTPLPVPTQKDQSKVMDFPSVELFMQRAAASNLAFQLTDENASFAAEICRRLDGLPLAIELAAARTRSLSPRLMLEQFDRRFDWLAHSGHDQPAWRQTLRGAIEWSYALLNEQERTLFCRLSVFSGSWSLVAAEEICSDDTQCPSSSILRLSLLLVEKSLLIIDPLTNRYQFLETLREYAKENLEKSAGFERYFEQHASYYTQLAKEDMSQLTRLEWLDQIEEELNNIRAALSYYTRLKLFNEAAETALVLNQFWKKRSYFTEARRWLETVVAMSKESTISRAKLLLALSEHYRVQGEYQLAESVAEESRIIFENFQDEVNANSAIDNLAMLAGIKGDYPRTIDLLEKVAVYRRNSGDKVRLLPALNNMAIANRRLGNLARATELYNEVVLIAEETGNLMSLGHSLFGLSEVQVDMGNYQTALEFSQRSLSVRYQLGDSKGVAYSLTAVAVAKSFLGDLAAATQLESAGQRLREELKIVITPIAQTEMDLFHSKLRESLGEDMFAQIWQKGKGLSMEQAFAFALKNI